MHASIWLASPPQRSPSAPTASAPQVCLENIGPRERSKRALFGVGILAIGLVIAATLIASGTGRGWRLALFIPFAIAGTGFFQAYEKT